MDKREAWGLTLNGMQIGAALQILITINTDRFWIAWSLWIVLFIVNAIVASRYLRK